jgi:hypothetical protein
MVRRPTGCLCPIRTPASHDYGCPQFDDGSEQLRTVVTSSRDANTARTTNPEHHRSVERGLDDEARFRFALEKIMRVTDPGDLRSVEARQAWEVATPARRIAREALGLPLGGSGVRVVTGDQLDAERRGQPLRHPAEVFHKRGLRCELGDDCALFDDEKG